MQTIVVTADLDTSVLPNDQQVTSVFGTDMSVQDTPRSVTAVSAQLLSDANIQNLSDFVKVAPSAYTLDQFGVASVPNIRGQLAEVFINGMQRTTRFDGPPTNFNSVESAQVINGPASSVFGPTANTGGYVNLVTKQPYFDRFHDDTEFTYGMYDEKKWTEDFGGPIIDKVLAYRVSYYGNYSGSYYDNVKTEENDAYVALKWTPNSDFTVDVNGDFYDGRFNEETGWNRPTQGLIDSHNYNIGGYTGFAGFDAGGNGTAPVAPPTGYGTFAGLINSPGTERLSPSSDLVAPVDSDFGKDANFQVKATYNINDDLSIVNNAYWEYFELRNYEVAQLYVNAADSNIVQDRLEVHYNFDIPISGGDTKTSDPKSMKDTKQMASISAPIDFKNQVVTGVAFKYLNALGYDNFFDESLNATDLTTGIFPGIHQFGSGGYPEGGIPGKNFPGVSGVEQPSTLTEEAEVVSAFWQHQIAFTPQWSLLYSGRGDLLFDDLGNPVNGVLNPNTFAIEPGGQGKESTTQLLGTGDVSLTYKPREWLTTYATFDFNQSTNGFNEAGGYNTYTNGNESKYYQFKNFLYEGGVKMDLLEHTLYGSWDGFYQTHVQATGLGSNAEIRDIGSEVSTTWQPNKNFYLTLNETYLAAYVIDPPAEFTENVYDVFATNSASVSGTGVGAPNFASYPTGHYRESGLPQMLFSGVATYRMDNGFGGSLSYQITDPIPTSEAENVWIPWQYEIDASLFYNYKRFGAKVTLYNITDQHNFSSGGFLAGSGNDIITIHEPFHMEGTVSYKF